jgi:uncharacterized protein YjbJ (UPF0337 family)
MNQDTLEGKWRQLRGRVKEQWGNLTDDELDRVAGKLDQLAGLIQGKYGYAREHIEAEIERLLGEEPGGAGTRGGRRRRDRAPEGERPSG